MQEKKIINLLVILSIILSLIGVFFVFSNDWAKIDYFLAGFNGSDQGTSKFSFLKYLPELFGLNQEKTYLLLFQNNLELRPSGGYLGSFAIIKFKNAKITHLGIHDTNIFDGFGQEQTQPPQPLQDHLGIENWQMRDGNWSPDYLISAKQVKDFYHLQGGEETFDGIIAVNATVLSRLLEIIGPVYLTNLDKEFTSENVLYELEYEVEKNYFNHGIEQGERKSALKIFIKKVLAELIDKKYLTDQNLRKLALEELDKKNILLYFKNDKLQDFVEKKDWGGRVENNYPGNYLMLVEANLIGKKSNAFIQRKVDYAIDYSNSKPKVNLEINFTHSNPNKDWFNHDYRCYLRVYLPKGSWLVKFSGLNQEPNFSQGLGKTIIGGYLVIPAGESKKISFEYLLPEGIGKELLIQKQPGIDSIEYDFQIKYSNKQDNSFNKLIWRDELIQL